MRQPEPFTARRVLFLLIGTLVIPSFCLAILGILGLMQADVKVTPYVVLMVLSATSIGLGTVLIARAAWRGSRLARLKTDFVSHVSHELRTPLTSIRMFIETLQLERAQTDEERQACLDMLAKETERLTEMIERVLEWSRIESGRKVFRAQPWSVEELVQASVAAFQAQQLDTTALVKLDIPDNLPDVWADRGAVIDVILNLLTNAFKYGEDPKKIEIHVSVRTRWVDIAVDDNGPGILRRDRKRIFDRFYRADDLLSRISEGTGLGLSIAKRLATGLGGRLTYAPRDGGGSRFTLRLQVVRSHHLEQMAREQTPLPAAHS